MAIAVEYDPMSTDFHNGAWGTQRWLLDNAPMYRNERMNFYALSRYDDVRDALEDWEGFISSEGGLVQQLNTPGFKAGTNTPGMVVWYDPPEHNWLRGLLNKSFTPRSIASIDAMVDEVVLKYIEPLEGRSSFEFMSEFSHRVPTEVILRLLNVPEADYGLFMGWSQDFMNGEDVDESGTNPRQIHGMTSMVAYVTELVRERRRNLGDDMLSRLIEARLVDEDGVEHRLSDDELGGYGFILAAAGIHTSATVLCGGMVQFHRNPDQWQKILADPAKIPNAVTEIGRIETSLQMVGRRCTKDWTRHGVTIPAGANVLILLAAANHDERMFEDPDTFNIERQFKSAPLFFGYGIHYCLGANLAKVELRSSIREFAKRFPEFSVDEPNLVRAQTWSVSGWAEVPMTV